MRGTRSRRSVAAVLAVAVVALAVTLASAESRNAAGDLVGGGGDRVTVADRSFRISGTLKGQLSPGVRRALNLSIRNPTPIRLWVRRLTVVIGGVDAPKADATHPCTTRDFAVRQARMVHPVKVGPRRTRDLVRLGLPSRRWARI